jgi:ABC-type glycerol-3-phosphate transport system permease component
MTITATDEQVRKNPPLVRRRVGRALFYLLMVTIGLILFTPFVLAFLGTFKSNAEIIAWPPSFFPSEWLFGNWPELFRTDFGGIPRPTGATSLGLMAGLLVFFSAFLLIGLSNQETGRAMLRRSSASVAVILAILSGVAAGWYAALDATGSTLSLTVGASVAITALIGVGILYMSEPDWQRVLIAMGIALALGVLATFAFERLAIFAGGGRFIRWFFNTALLSVVRAFLMVIFSSMAAYAFARLRFPGKNFIFGFMLATMMIPGAVKLIPEFIVIAKMGWLNTSYGLVMPKLVDAFGIFLLTQFLKSIPRDLEESALIDGASYFQIYSYVVMPLAKPALLTLFILQFQGMWNDFLTPLLYLNTPDMWVLNVALSVFQQQYRAQWNLTLVGAMVNGAVPLTMFFFFSRYYIEGVSYSGLKG